MKLSELFTDESKWVKNMNAGVRGSNGITAPTFKRGANCWCLIGGTNQVAPLQKGSYHLREKLRDSIATLFPGKWEDSTGFISIGRFNDHPDTTFADVQAVIRHVEAS